jgi:GDPmannose 4,6-dehydratase
VAGSVPATPVLFGDVPRALITGVTGQDGRFLAQFLFDKGYQVFGLVSGQSNPRLPEIERTLPFIEIISGDVRDITSLVFALEQSQPDEVYNLAAISQVLTSYQQVDLTMQVSGIGTLHVLEAVRMVGGSSLGSPGLRSGPVNPIRLFQASSAAVFGRATVSPQDESTPFRPANPHGVAKTFAHQITVNYRESYGLHASCGILFNHGSEHQGSEFVSRKVTRAVGRIVAGLQDHVVLGDLHPRRDWGFAGDYVAAMWAMVQQPTCGDYVIATGVAHSVEELVVAAFAHVGITEWERYVRQDKRFMRPTDSALLVGDASKARQVLAWSPTVGFEELIGRMVDHDVALAKAEASRRAD